MADPERVQLLEEIADGVVDMLDGEPSGSDSLDWALERYGYVPTKGVEAPVDAPAGQELPDADNVWFCFSCEDANVTRSDEDRCCLMCGVDLTSLGHVRALLATQGLHIVTHEERQRMVQDALDAVHTKAERKVLEACAALKISTDAIGPVSANGKPQICSSTMAVAAAEFARRGGKS